MRRLIGFVVFIAIAVSCNKEATVALTTEEQLAYDVNIIDTYLAENKIDAIKLESGVRYRINEAGTGPVPTKDNCVRYRYTVTLLYETDPFNSNTTDWGIKSPLKQLVTGMQIAMKNFPVGTKATVFLPSGLAYGTRPNSDGTIPANAILRFEIEMLALTAYNSLGDYCN
jgi:FKBP-type peptidyl-prolyl cis-trans isomerase FkpA